MTIHVLNQRNLERTVTTRKSRKISGETRKGMVCSLVREVTQLNGVVDSAESVVSSARGGIRTLVYQHCLPHSGIAQPFSARASDSAPGRFTG